MVLIAGSAYLGYYFYQKAKTTVDEIGEKFDKLTDKNKFTGTRNTDKRFTGDFLDALIVPKSGNESLIFMLLDGSKKYYETKKRPGYYSTGVSCYDCKTTVYIYDHEKDNIIYTADHTFPDMVARTDITLINGKIYQFNDVYNETPAGVIVYDAITGKIIEETPQFIQKYPELNSGITT